MIRRMMVSLAVALCLFLVPLGASAHNVKTPCIFDLLLIRPLGAIAVVAGTVGIVAITPFVVVWPPDGRVQRMYQTNVVEPAKYVFVDELCSH